MKTKYFFDTEFLEGEQEEYILGVPVEIWAFLSCVIYFLGMCIAIFYDQQPSAICFALVGFLSIYFYKNNKGKYKTAPTIDLISIGIVDENGREYYAISNEFNLREAWNRYDLVPMLNKGGVGETDTHKMVYWIRENVLRTIWLDYIGGEEQEKIFPFTFRNMKKIIAEVGKSRSRIANDICAFIYGDDCGGSGMSPLELSIRYEVSDKTKEPEFYAYYADYDWVVFCWIFGKMMQLPKGFPLFCKDLKQIMDEKGFDKEWRRKNLPDPIGEHNALVDARWNLKLYNLMNSI